MYHKATAFYMESNTPSLVHERLKHNSNIHLNTFSIKLWTYSVWLAMFPDSRIAVL